MSYATIRDAYRAYEALTDACRAEFASCGYSEHYRGLCALMTKAYDEYWNLIKNDDLINNT